MSQNNEERERYRQQRIKSERKLQKLNDVWLRKKIKKK